MLDTIERPNLNTGLPWSGMSVWDLRFCVEAGCSLQETADFLCRTRQEVREKAMELGLRFETPG